MLIGELGATIDSYKDENEQEEKEYDSETTEWQALIPKTMMFVTSSETRDIRAGLTIMSVLISFLPDKYAKYTEDLCKLIKNNLQHKDKTVKASALAALACSFEYISDKYIKGFLEITNTTFEVAQALIINEDEKFVTIF
jgi:hypothetical protein